MFTPSVDLVEFLARNPLPWVRYDAETQKLIVVADNHLLSTYRNCAQHFFFSNVFGHQKKSGIREGERQRSWYLDFGVLLHKMLEVYYRDFKRSDFDVVLWAVERASAEWHEMAMDAHAEHKEYKLIGGIHGFVGLLMQYANTMSPLNEKLRVLGQEVSFGRSGEVPLLQTETLDIFLAGRMDLIVDDGYFICPMDHKTTGAFRGDPALMFETDEGPAGYIFALSKILPTIVPEGEFLKRDCSKILMNLIQKKPTDNPAERFRRVPVRKSAAQLEAYQDRMITTVLHLVNDLENIAQSLPVPRNTTACMNWHYGRCDYQDVCRQSGPEAEAATLKNGFLKLPIWDTEEVKQTI